MGSDFELMEWLKKGSGFVALSTLFTPFDYIGFDAITTGIATHNQAGFAIVGF
jgi:hypothetical protein